MDTKDDNKKRLASSIVIITSVLLCSLASWFFTMAGASFGGGIVKWTDFVWTLWGGVAYLLIKGLLKRRRALYGLLYGLGAGFIIGLVNGLLTETAIYGVIIGIILGPGPGLILA